MKLIIKKTIFGIFSKSNSGEENIRQSRKYTSRKILPRFIHKIVSDIFFFRILFSEGYRYSDF